MSHQTHIHVCHYNYLGDGKGLELYKGLSPPTSGSCQAPHHTYCQHIISTRYIPSTKIHTHIQHICQVQQAVTAPGSLQLPQHIHIANTYVKCSKYCQHQGCSKHHKIHILPTHMPNAASTDSTRCTPSTTIQTHVGTHMTGLACTVSTRCAASTTIHTCPE